MIRFDSVTKTYQRGHTPALADLTIEFARGEFVFLVGASGSGKSTLMRLVLKETSPTRGNVYVAGKDLARIPSWRVPTLRRDIGMVFQDFRLLPSKTAYQNIEFALAVIGTPRKVVRRLVPEMLEMVGLEDKGGRLPHELSGGEQQRVAIARAYVNRPSILLADEPTGNLDPATAEGILDLLSQINERGTTVVMATHDRHAVDRMERRVVEMVGGYVVRDEEAGRYQSVIDASVISGNAQDGEELEKLEVAVDGTPLPASASTPADAPAETRAPRIPRITGRRRAAAVGATAGDAEPVGTAESETLLDERPIDPDGHEAAPPGSSPAEGAHHDAVSEESSTEPAAASSPWIEDAPVEDVVDEDHYDPRDVQEDVVDSAFEDDDEDLEADR